MHIAVCDDNIADRKQMERLLHRASDRFKAEHLEGFFIDLYGNIPALMQYPQMYDAIFLDMVDAEQNGLEVARNLRKKGVVCSIILCCGDLNYQEMAQEDFESFLFMNKPILVDELDKMLHLCEKNRAHPEPMIELRGENETIYAHSQEVIAAKAANTSFLDVYLTDQRTQRILSTAANFYSQLETFNCFIPVSDFVIVNVTHIVKFGKLSVTMDNGAKYRASVHYLQNIHYGKEMKEVWDALSFHEAEDIKK